MGIKRALNSRVAAVGVGAAALALLAGGAGYAAGQIDSSDIENDSVKSIDVKDGTLKMKDLRPGVVDRLDSRADVRTLQNQLTQLATYAAGLEERIAELEDAQDPSDDWLPNDGTTIDGPNSVTMADNDADGTSIEIQNLDVTVEQGDTITFVYKPNGGFVYGAGSPRVFVKIGDTFYNTFDSQPDNPGTDNGDGTFTVTYTLPAGGTVTHAGIVNDGSSPGSVTVTDVKIGDHDVSFD